MNTNNYFQDSFEVFPSPVFNPFPEPRDFPSGWDLSGFKPASRQASVNEADSVPNVTRLHRSSAVD